jgi:hypothetical protein
VDALDGKLDVLEGLIVDLGVLVEDECGEPVFE